MRKLILVLVLLSPLSVVLGSAIVVDETRIIRGSFDLESDTLIFSQHNFDSKIRSILSNASGNSIDPDHLVLSSSYLEDKSDDLSIMKYVQKFKGLNIHSSRIIVGIKDGKVVTLKSNYYPEIDIDTEPTLSKEDIMEIIENDIGFQLIRSGLKPLETFSFEELQANKSAFVRKIYTSENGTTIEDILLEIYPESTSTEIKYHLAYKVELGLNISPPSKWVYIIDANNGEILEKYNKVVFTTLSGHVTGRIYPEHPNQSLEVKNFWNETLYDFTDHLSNIFWSGKNDNLDNYIFTKNPINITNVSSATLEFKTKFFMENGHDFGYVVLSTDGRNYSNFEEYTGIKGDWSTIKIDLSSFIGQQIWIGFRYITDNVNSDNGWYIDDIAVLTNNGSIFNEFADNFTNWNENGFSVIQQEVASTQKLGKTGADGFYSLSGLQDSFTLSTGLAGEFVDVINETGVNANHYAIITTPSTHEIEWENDDTSYKKEQSNVFYHINLVHDFFTKGSPFNINAMNYLTHAYVQYPGTCNAFSDGTNIYFSGAGGGCESASLFSDIIYHEYTHNVIDHMYTNNAPVLPYRVESGAFNEGLADYFASSINGNPCIAEGLDGDCLRYLNNTYRFPEDVAGETHKDGRIVSGSSWDLREMLGSDISDSLVINALKLEPFNFSEYLDDIIVADDNNANLEDGTPHLFEICTAFFKNHGIFSSYCNMYYRSPLTVNLLKNPGFESESANWTEYSNEGHLIIKKNPMGTYSGNWLAYMGDYNDVDQYIFQDITIPSRIEKAYVQFWYWIRSKETTEGSANDIMRIEVRRPDDDTLLKSLGTLSNLNKSYGYSISEQYDLSEFKNETIRLKLTTTTDPFEPTAFLVDDIGLMVVYDTIPPDIDYVPPTPANNSNLSQNSIIVNITASEIVNASILEWDGINETMAGSGINWYTEKTGLNDGKYVYKVRCNDSSDNWNENEARVVTVDTRPPIITANPTGYPANQMVSKNGDTIFFNVTIIDPVSNIRNASVSVSQINKSLDRIVLDPNNGFWTNSSVIMNVSDGQYYLNISAYDYAGNVNNTEYLAVIVDTTPPIVHSSQALYQRRDTANNLSIIEINVSANDPFVNGISAGLRNASVNASIINTTGIIELVNLSGFWKGIVIFDKYIAEGNYSMNVTVYDNAGNINDSMKVFLSKDSTPPSPTEVSLIGLPQESQISDSAGAIRTFSITANQTVNVTWYINGTEVKSGEKGVTSAYTNTSAAQGTWIVNATATNANDTVSKEWKWIVNPPLIITITSPDNNSENINGDIIVTVNLNRDGTALLNWNGANESMIKAGTSFYKNKTGLPSGNYSFQIYANDSNGVINASETRIVTVNKTLIDNTIGNFINTSNFIVNSTLEIASPSRNTTLVISNGTNASIAGAPLTWISIESTTKINSTFTASLASNDKFVGENVTLGPSGAVFNPSIRIRFNYTDAQLTAAQITASQLRVKFYDTTTNTWVEQTPYNLNETGKYITINASHFSTFVLLGTKSPTTSNPPPGSGSGGGGGGGGGGASGENYTNIEVIEKYDLWISKDALTSYRFNHAKNPIMFVNITGNASYGIITTSVEVLKNISSLVKTRPEGLVYRNVNIWVGTSGFATLKNIKEASIMFRVDTSWISLNNLSSSDIKLLKWDGSQWMTLDTKVNEKDGTNTYFEGRTDNFSEFAITGIKAQGGPSAGGPSNEAEIKPTGTHVAATNTPTTTTNPKQKAPGFQIVTVIAALSTFYIFQRKRSSERKLKVRNLKS